MNLNSTDSKVSKDSTESKADVIIISLKDELNSKLFFKVLMIFFVIFFLLTSSYPFITVSIIYR